MADPSHAEVEAALAILAAAEAARAAEALRAAEAAAAPAVAAPTVEPVVEPVVRRRSSMSRRRSSCTPPSPFAARIATLNEFAAIYTAYTPLPNVSGFENDALARAFDRQQVNALTNVLSR